MVYDHFQASDWYQTLQDFPRRLPVTRSRNQTNGKTLAPLSNRKVAAKRPTSVTQTKLGAGLRVALPQTNFRPFAVGVLTSGLGLRVVSRRDLPPPRLGSRARTGSFGIHGEPSRRREAHRSYRGSPADSAARLIRTAIQTLLSQ